MLTVSVDLILSILPSSVSDSLFKKKTLAYNLTKHRACISIVMFLGVYLYCSSIQAQTNNLRCKLVSTQIEIYLDTLLVAPQSIEIAQSIAYHFNPATSSIAFDQDENYPDSVIVCYRTFPSALTNSFMKYDLATYDSSALFKHVQPIINQDFNQREEFFHTENIYKVGSLTRGISFGNSQSVNVNSSLNFQMEGKLSEELNVRATITDQNIPFQPEGNTQRLREFDNVFIEVFNENLSLKGGDIVLKNPSSNFLKYNKNVQGGQFDIDYKLKDFDVNSSITVSAAKGQFADITIEPLEGVQGPYKLRGPNGERFVVVLANSEQVYLDGQLLKRGYDNEYVIDYNLGEVVFNPNVLITRFSRIRITYEYSDQNYSRSIMSTNHQLTLDNTSIYVNFYREKDNRNRPLAFELSDEDKFNLSQAGEENLPVRISSDKETSFNENLILYQKNDTVDLDGNAQEVLVFSRDSTQVLFQASFSEVGTAQGNYILLDNTINGRVFQWVSPQGGVPSGNFEPVLFVPAPNMRQMATIGFESQLTQNDGFFGELAISNHDLNLFSDLSDSDNSGVAFKVGYIMKDRILKNSPDYKWSAEVNFEHDGNNFNPIDRFRYIEYDRDWSYNPAEDTAVNQDNIFNLTTRLEKDVNNKFQYDFTSRSRGEVINGTQHNANIRKKLGSLYLSSTAYLMNNSRRVDESQWKKAEFETYFDRLIVVPGYRFQLDMNEVRNSVTDSVTASAMNFISHQFYLRNNDSLRSHFRLQHTVRTDRRPLEGKVQDFSESNTTSLSIDSKVGNNSNLDLVLTYRNLKFIDPVLANNDEETILGRLDWTGKYLDSHITTEISYATSSSRELRREFVFLPVNNGEGTHTWRDLNMDGIQDISEFFEAINLDERNYVKIFVPTDEFIAAFNNVLNLSLNAQMPRSWRKAQGFKKFAAKFSNRINININKKNTEDSFESRFNPFDLNTSDENLVFVKTAIRNNLFFNKSNPGFGFDVEYFNSNSKQLITKGIETRSNQRIALNNRWNINRETSINWSFFNELKENTSDFLEERNFKIRSNSVAPQFIWQPGPRFRATSKYEHERKDNILATDQDESSTINAFSIDVRWTKAIVNSLDVSFKYSNIDFSGDENTPAAYELLEALRPGSNFIWNVNYRQKLSGGLQMTLGYSGRKSPEQNVIHLGRMQLTALF